MSVEAYLTGERESEIRQTGVDCRPFSSDLLVRTGKDRYRYPDVVVVCDEQFLDDYSTESPVLIVEVLSKATRQRDRQVKRLEYLRLPSLQEYMLIEQDTVEVEIFRRSDSWRPSYYYWGDMVVLESVGLSLSVESIYEWVRNEDVSRLLIDK